MEEESNIDDRSIGTHFLPSFVRSLQSKKRRGIAGGLVGGWVGGKKKQTN